MPLLITGVALLLIVLVPGLGHSVNGSRRWLRLAGANFQVSELARVLVLIYVASYAVRRENELRETFMGLGKPLALLTCGRSAAARWSRTSARPPCSSPPASGCCSSPAHACAT